MELITPVTTEATPTVIPKLYRLSPFLIAKKAHSDNAAGANNRTQNILRDRVFASPFAVFISSPSKPQFGQQAALKPGQAPSALGACSGLFLHRSQTFSNNLFRHVTYPRITQQVSHGDQCRHNDPNSRLLKCHHSARQEHGSQNALQRAARDAHLHPDQVA